MFVGDFIGERTNESGRSRLRDEITGNIIRNSRAVRCGITFSASARTRYGEMSRGRYFVRVVCRDRLCAECTFYGVTGIPPVFREQGPLCKRHEKGNVGAAGEKERRSGWVRPAQNGFPAINSNLSLLSTGCDVGTGLFHFLKIKHRRIVGCRNVSIHPRSGLEFIKQPAEI